MEEKRTGGKKEFLFSVLWAIFLLIIGRFIIFSLPDYKVIGTIITLIFFCILGFFALTRYSAIFTYTLKGTRFRANRKIGHRNKEYEAALSSIKSVTKKRPKNSPRAHYMCTTVFSKKDRWYIVYRKNHADMLLVCTISGQMAEKIIGGTKHAK